MLNSAWFIARRDLAHNLRQKENLLWIFVMPIVFFYFIGTVTAGFGDGGQHDEPDPLALLAPEAGGFLVDELVRRLEQEDFAVQRPVDRAAFDQATRRLTIPEPPAGYGSFTEAVLAGEQARLLFGRDGEGPGADFDQVRVARAVYGVLADLVVAGDAGQVPDAEAFARLQAQPRAITLDVRPAGKRLEPPSGFDQAIPGTLVMFTMLVLLTGGAILLVIEREQGLLRRLAATPIPRSSIVLGKWIGKMALALVQIAFAMIAGTLIFDMRWGSALPMVCLVLFAWAAFNASLGILLANLARSEAQMSGLAVLVTMVLAALGGCWWPIEITPDWMQGLAIYLPTGWTMDAIHKLVSFGDGASAAVPHVLAGFAGALVLGWLGARTFRFR